MSVHLRVFQKTHLGDGETAYYMEKYQGEDRVVSSHEVVKEQGSFKDIPRLKSGINGLDKLCDGFLPGEMIVLTGQTKMGKTSIARTLTEQFIEQGHECLWFSYEEPYNQFLASFEPLPKFYLPRQLIRKDAAWIEQRIIEAKAKYGIKAVFVDHLGYLIDAFQFRNAALEIGSIVRQIRLLALKHEIVLFLLHHVKRISENKNPTHHDLRDSELIAAEASAVLIIWRTKTQGAYGDFSTLAVDIHRRTGVREKRIKLKYNGKRFEEVDAFAFMEDVPVPKI